MSEWGSGNFNEEAKWVQIQQKTFTRWANTFLKERMLKIEDLKTDLADGIMLINLLEIISSKSLGKYNQKPKMRPQYLENNGFALKFLAKEGIKLVNIGAEDITDKKLKLILGLIWTIILRYQINIQEGNSARSDLLKWVQKQIPEYGITNFSSNWNDGKAICALGNSLKPGICPNHRELDPSDALNNAILGTDTAERELDIPKVLAPEDMINPEVDELSVMTYISYYRDWEANQLKKREQELIERTPVPENCKVYGPGWEKAETGIPTEFTIEAINAFNRRLQMGGTPFVVTIEGPNGPVQVDVEDHNNGTYTGRYTPHSVGPHNCAVTLFEKHISGSPKVVSVTRGAPDASKCLAYGPGLEGGEADKPANFTIESKNRAGNQVKDGGDPFKVTVEGPYNTPVPVDIVDNKDGTYSVAYHPTEAGDHKVVVELEGKPVADSPYNVSIDKSSTAPDPLHCVAYGPGLEGGNTAEPSTFTVEARNKHNELIVAPGLPIEVMVTSPEGNSEPVDLKDNADGTFSVTYQANDPGTFRVDVVVRNKTRPLYFDHIKDSPFHVTIEAGTDANKSTAYGPGLEDGIPDTLPTHFFIQAKDKFGKNMEKGGDPFAVNIEGPNGPVPAQISDNGDGTYRVDYEPTDAGQHKVHVTLKDKPISNSPYHVNVKEGADDENSGIESFTFTIRARTKKGENKKDGGDDFKVVIRSADEEEVPEVKVKDIGDGSYLVSYKLPGQGEYKVDVLLNGKHIKGSPWKQHI